MHKRNSHCTYCGKTYELEQPWPRQCVGCQNISYLNPIPVSVVVLPVDKGVLTIRRNIEPRKGKLALPGGFINMGESWQEAGARELYEETGIRIEAENIQLFNTLSAPDGTVLVFGLANQIKGDDLPTFAASAETSEIIILRAPDELAFPLHTQVLRDYFAKYRS
jgi:ADP-ribose pyrophosphatase YjhB (NUDIX family)